jgi:hypothetical protein
MARSEVLILLVVSALIVFFPSKYKQVLLSKVISIPLFWWPLFILGVLQLIVQFRDTTIQPFIYFQF